MSPLGGTDAKNRVAKEINAKVFGELFPAAITKILESQSPRVDAVSGATATTNPLLKAVENALVSAGGKVIGD